ncbi:cytochrome c oxidase assembly protein [Kallotenue papyrolyticum]|uniref:cytochrome c oxidase assembly protein n=1 Tax=Kallotenue papyrolyticum TaxID=1325125 RepID=UPI000492A01D|nr:cytochrome c oxidase assembly protein [Kallotenue papyrolyticum]
MGSWLELIAIVGHPFAPHQGSWLIIEPAVLTGLTLIGALYLYAVGPWRRRAGWAPDNARVPLGRFLLGLLVLFVALQGPLHELSDYYLFSAHMLQHLLVTMVAPPLLLTGLPSWLVDRLLLWRGVLPLARALTTPLVAFLVFNAVFALWHAPQFYQAALGRPLVHGLEHSLLLATALLTWWPIFSPSARLPRAALPVQIVYLFAQTIVPTILGALITFAPAPLYPFYAAAPRMWGLAPLTDQQIAGLIMWLGGALIMLAVLTARFFRWLGLEADEPAYHMLKR